jgi:hypothetical protein
MECCGVVYDWVLGMCVCVECEELLLVYLECIDFLV